MNCQERDQFFEELAEDFFWLRADPVASADYDAELAVWNCTLLDGLGAPDEECDPSKA